MKELGRRPRQIPIVLLLCLSLMTSAGNALAVATPKGSLSNFQRKNNFSAEMFSDVQAEDWFYGNVKAAYEYGLMVGDSATTFRPNGNVTLAETITLAARLHSQYYTGKSDFKDSTPWYKAYVDYAAENGILLVAYEDYDRAATRAEYAVILSAAFPDDALAKINQVPDNSIPDVKMDTTYGGAVYRMYRAGILMGNDNAGTFAPNSNIRRSEVAAIISRMADAGKRIVKKADRVPESGSSSDDDPTDEAELPAATKPPVEIEPAIYNPSFVIGSGHGKKGAKDVAVTVAVKNNPGIASIGMTVSYDSALTLKSIVYNDAIGGNYMLPPTMSNPVKLVWVSPFANVEGDWTLATLYFDVKEDASPGYHQIAAVCDPDDVFDITTDNVAFEVINGSIYVAE